MENVGGVLGGGGGGQRLCSPPPPKLLEGGCPRPPPPSSYAYDLSSSTAVSAGSKISRKSNMMDNLGLKKNWPTRLYPVRNSVTVMCGRGRSDQPAH